MIGTCSNCGNHKWDKQIEEDMIICPFCGSRWRFLKKPIFFLTGCSGIGKTTTGIEIQRMTTDFAVLDADMYYNIMPHDCDADYLDQIEQIYSLSKNISQCGKAVVWTMAGNIDKLNKAYNSSFFQATYVLALTCSEEELKARLINGRGISDEGWIEKSLEYNHYFVSHSTIGEVKYDKLEITDKPPKEAAKLVLAWLYEKSRDEENLIE